jgi:PAS domain S-box-containing protein
MNNSFNQILLLAQSSIIGLGGFVFLQKIYLAYNHFIFSNQKISRDSISLDHDIYSPILQPGKIKEKNNLSIEKESLDNFFNYSPIGFLRVAKNGNVLLFNSSALKILGFSCREELVSMNYFSNTFRNKENTNALNESLLKSEDFIFEGQWKKQTGTNAFIKEYFRVLPDIKESVSYYEISIEDITEKKRIDRALQITEEKFRTIIDQIPLGIYRTIATGEIIFSNYYFAKILGHKSPYEFKGKNFGSFLLHSKEYENKLRNQISLKQSSSSCEYIMVKTDGTNIWVHETSNLIFDTSDELLFCEGTIEDITAKKKAEDELSRLIVAISQISEAIVITSTEGNILYTNPAFEKMTLYTFDEVKNQNISILRSGKHSKEFYKKILSTVHAGNTWSGRIINKKKDGGVYEEHMVISPIKNIEGQIMNFVAVKRDITEERKAEQEINQSKKLQAIGTLAGGIAHDFNNILMGMQIYTEILLKKMSQSPSEYDLLLKIFSAQNRAKDLIKQILSFSRQSGDDLKPIEIHSVVQEAIKLIQSTFPPTLKLEQKINDCGYINGNATQIHQIIMNLCSNACHAMEGNGQLTIDLEKVDNIENPEGIKVYSNNYWIKLKVKDTGCGIEKKVMDRIFEPFFTTKSVGQGLGLGLAMVHGIVKQYGGEIYFNSEIGKGTVFYLYLPAL